MGIMIGIPAIRYLGSRMIYLPFNRLLGNLSYGVFLSHFTVIWFFEAYYPNLKESSPYNYFVFEFSILIS